MVYQPGYPKKSMPKSKPPAKRQYNRRKKASTAMSIPTAPSAYYLCKLKYCENFQFNISSLTPMVNRVFRVNDLFDPNFTGVGHQPFFRDQLYTLYSRARVLSSKITVQFAPNSNQAVEVVLAPISDGAVDTDYTLLRERKGAKSTIVNLGALKYLSAVSKTSTALGVPKDTVLKDDRFIQYISGVLDVSATNYWQLGANLMDPSGTACIVMTSIKIEMVALFSDVVQQTAS